MPPKPPGNNWKHFFIRGIALLLPTILTILILVKAYQFIDAYLIRYVNIGVAAVLDRFGLYEALTAEVQVHWTIRYLILAPVRWFFEYALGFVVSILFVYAVGLLIGTLVGRRVWQAVEGRLMRFPVVRLVYPFIRQVTDFFFRERAVAFETVVAIEYPRKGVWSVGFMTGGGFTQLQNRRPGIPGDLVSVFVPSSPTPMTGYVIFLPREDTIPLDITVDQAFRLIVSGGVIKPSDTAGSPEPRGGRDDHTAPTPSNGSD